ncbi:hypothetical protein PAPYR_3933 [Paratrimastix pyriformis]|uniref:Uncharacterized protein n=1 Tax=Paratrimastix pyriformis TaxID=342808 RepID=A0ABQ8UN25_9EUKA|nr:hypothetical protein PAPYR_3933 [Paratrimastix pyriformis]
MDLFSEKHLQHYPDGRFEATKTIRKNRTGGLMAIVYTALCLALVAQYGAQFLIDNVAEVKAIIPMVVPSKDMQPKMTTISPGTKMTTRSIYVGLLAREYGGFCRCGPGSEGFTDVLVNMTGITPVAVDAKHPAQAPDIRCSRKEPDDNRLIPWAANDLAAYDCLVEMTCTNCIVEPTAAVTMAYVESKSYCFGYVINVTTDTAIPMQDHQRIIQKSSVSAVGARLGNILRGVAPTEFVLKLVPSVFEDTDGSTNTGFHVFTDQEVPPSPCLRPTCRAPLRPPGTSFPQSHDPLLPTGGWWRAASLTPVGRSPVMGSQVSFSEFAYVKGLSARVNLDYVGYAMKTAHTNKRGVIEVGSLILGALSGLLGIFGMGVSTLETLAELWLAWRKKRRAAQRVKEGLPPDDDDEGPGQDTTPGVMEADRVPLLAATAPGPWGVQPLGPPTLQPNPFFPGARPAPRRK